MKRLAPRSPLSRIEGSQNCDTPIEQTKRKVKIYTQKLPCGFFSEARNTECLRQPSTRRSKINNNEYMLKPSEFSIKQQRKDEICRTAASSQIHGMSQDEFKNNDQQLLMGLINSARSMRRMLRKHSLELKKTSQIKQEVLQLPPLNINKGKYTVAL